MSEKRKLNFFSDIERVYDLLLKGQQSQNVQSELKRQREIGH